MKKRSLVAALAMLMVSAIVLTSSTYAWFATSSAASVDKISAQVTNNSGSLTVQAVVNGTPGAKKTTLTSSDYAAAGLTSNLQPVTLYIDDQGAVNVNKVSYNATEFSGFTAATKNSEYLYYEFNAEYINGANEDPTNITTTDVKITPTFAIDNAAQFLYGLLAITVDDVTTYYVYNASGSYVPLKSLSNTVTDNGSSANIVDENDDGYSVGDMATVITDKATAKNSGDAFTLMSVDSGTTKTAKIAVYVWAEGQDAQCSGTVNAASCGFSFSLGL